MNITDQINLLPEPLRPAVVQRWSSFSENDLAAVPDEVTQTLVKVWACSEFVMENCVRFPQMFIALAQSGDLTCSYDREQYKQSIVSELPGNDEEALKKHLRLFRCREMLRIIWRDIAGWADLKETTADLSHMAEACIDYSLNTLYDWQCQQLGTPCNAEGEAQQLVVIGMGKLGAWELNLSSDIDLIFCFPEEGETQGSARATSNSQFFTRLGQKLIQSLDQNTADGFVFRVDMRLRPFGDGGALALSFAAMEHYYQVHGREWERYAMIKARIVGGDREAGQELMDTLRPFVFRRYIDYGAYDSLREMKDMIDKQVKRKSMANNVKLGAGGIREVEFIAQVFQLIRGGRDRSLQARKVLRVLRHLQETGLLPAFVVEQLVESYIFLRNTEHRLQAWRDQQTHDLPKDDIGRLRLAYSMGFEDWDSFYAVLSEHHQQVHFHFEQVFQAPQTEHTSEAPNFDDMWNDVLDDDVALALLEEKGYQQADAVLKQLDTLRSSRAYASLSAKGRERLDDLMPLLLGAVSSAPNVDVTFERLLALIMQIARRSVYIALLVENPLALSQLVRLCSASPWIAKFLMQYPLLLDELINVSSLYAPPNKEQLVKELRQRLAAIPRDDEEQQMEALRHFKHSNVLRVAAADISNALPLMHVSDYLTWIAEAVLDEALEQAWNHLVAKHGRPVCTSDGKVCDKGFAVIGYGKLGGIELGYGSDLDLVFLHGGENANLMTEGDKPVAIPVFFARLGQRLIHILTAHTPAGVLYETDMRLRPDGASGMLVSNLSSFESYQDKKAWLWEHQALVRARVVAGDPEIAQRFDAIRRDILSRQRDRAELATEVSSMREKMRNELDKTTEGEFNIKQGKGGIVDIEFLVQYMVLAYACEHPALLDWTDNIRILETLVQVGLMSQQESDSLCETYRSFRRRVHKIALQEEKAVVPAEEFSDERAVVQQAWQKWLGC